MLIDSLVKGGRERRLIELLKGLNSHKDIGLGLVLFSKKVAYPEVFDMDIPIHYLERQPAKDPRVFYRLYQIAKREKAHILHSWGWMPSIYAVPTAKWLGIKLINAAITDAPNGMRLWDTRYFRAQLTMPFSDAIVSNSKAGLNAYDAPVSNSYFIYNGFDFNRIKSLASPELIRAKYQIPNGPIIGMVGGFYERKDFDTYLLAANHYLDQRQDACFLAIGDGPELERCKALIHERHRSRVIFTGMVHGVESLINLFDIGVLAGKAVGFGEGISNAIMEYMVLGKAVVATNSGGTSEIVLDGETGFVVPPADPLAMAQKIAYLIDRPRLLQQYGQAGQKRIQQYFSLDRMEKDYLELYNSLGIRKTALSL